MDYISYGSPDRAPQGGGNHTHPTREPLDWRTGHSAEVATAGALEHLATKHWWPSLEFSDGDLDLLDWASQYWQNPTLPFNCMTQG